MTSPLVRTESDCFLCPWTTVPSVVSSSEGKGTGGETYTSRAEDVNHSPGCPELIQYSNPNNSFGAGVGGQQRTCAHHFLDRADLNKCGPGKAEYVVAISLPKLAGCHAACAEVHKKSQNIHVLVNNAGTIVTAPFNDVPEKEGWDDVLDPGRVIVMSSAAALHYNAEVLQKFDISDKASKASAMNLSTTLAVTLGPNLSPSTQFAGHFVRQLENRLTWNIQWVKVEHPSRAGAHVSDNHILSGRGAIAAGEFT
ncbi:hypothetical protein H4Q26_010842 [Puccinia striiformis f. sp. tritici PST-130]|nr:hypothetical protein H4Q26_010842 [Puccinia striiformis f. sp. tritici PST-130]